MYIPKKLTAYEKKELHILSVRWQQLFMEKLQLIEKREKALQELHALQSQIIEHTNELSRLDGIRQQAFEYIQSKPVTNEEAVNHI